jgi:hypothetical protein
MWAALSGQRKTPFAEVHLDFVLGTRWQAAKYA